MKPKLPSRTFGEWLLFTAVVVSAPRWAGAMLAADVSTIPAWLSGALSIANTVSGVAMGVLEVLAVAYMLDSLRTTQPAYTTRSGRTRRNWRWWGSLIFTLGLFALSPLILAPYIVARMRGVDIMVELWTPALRYAWSVAVIAAPAFVVGGIAFARPGLVGSDARATHATQPNARADDDATLAMHDITHDATQVAHYPRPCDAPGCVETLPDRFRWAAHQRKHRNGYSRKEAVNVSLHP